MNTLLIVGVAFVLRRAGYYVLGYVLGTLLNLIVALFDVLVKRLFGRGGR